MPPRTSCLLSAVLLASLCSVSSFAQESSGLRSLTISAQSDSERSRALLAVTLDPADGSPARVADLRSDGAHTFQGLPSGHYTARLYSRDGYQQLAVSLTGDLYHRELVVDPSDLETLPRQPHPVLFFTVLLDDRPVPDRLVRYTVRSTGAGELFGTGSTNARGELRLESKLLIPGATVIELALAGANPIELQVDRVHAPLWASFSSNTQTFTLRDCEGRPIPSAWLRDSQSPYKSKSDRQGRVDLPPAVVRPKIRYQRWWKGEMTTVHASVERRASDLIARTDGSHAHVVEVDSDVPGAYYCLLHVGGHRIASLSLLGGCGYFADLPLPTDRPLTIVAIPILLDGSRPAPLCATFTPPFGDRLAIPAEPPHWINLSLDESVGPPLTTPTRVWTHGSRAERWELADHYADQPSPRTVRVLGVPHKHYRIARAGRIADYIVPAHPVSADQGPETLAFEAGLTLQATIGPQQRLTEPTVLFLEARSVERSWRLPVPTTDTIELTVDATTPFPLELFLVGPFGECGLGHWNDATHEPTFELPEDAHRFTVQSRP